MMYVVGGLAVIAGILSIASATQPSRVPLWIPVLLLSIAVALWTLAR